MSGTKKKVGEIVDAEGPFVVSKFEDETFSFSWELQNFSRIKKRVMTPPFRHVVGPNHERNWCLEVCPKNEKEGVDYLGVFLNLSSEAKPKAVHANYQISLLDSDQRILITMGSTVTREFKPTGQYQGWGLLHWIKTSELEPRGFLTNDTLRIHCFITTLSELKHQQFDYKSVEEHNHWGLVKKQMKSLLNSGEFSDITLKSTTSSFSCSKIVLSAHSPVFHAMFNSGMLETKENVVKIEDFADEVVKGMLDFLYIGQVESLSDNAMELLKIGDKYQIEGLKNMCAEFLFKELTIDSAAATLILADLHGPLSLKQNVISFITRNRKAFRRTDGFILMKEHHKTILADLFVAME